MILTLITKPINEGKELEGPSLMRGGGELARTTNNYFLAFTKACSESQNKPKHTYLDVNY